MTSGMQYTCKNAVGELIFEKKAPTYTLDESK